MKNITLAEIENLPRDYLTAQEVSAVMGIASSTLYKNYAEMPFPVLRIGRNYRIPKKPFLMFMKTGSIGN
ncbi:MAG: helix-turn-helix domain-containing protein [Prevotella sp.]|nr:helix-turn-helix domain-containing protein [Prevotella sp.]